MKPYTRHLLTYLCAVLLTLSPALARADDSDICDSLMESLEYKSAYPVCKQAADQGDADAQYSLGLIYFSGLGVEKNVEEAVKWFRLSAEQGVAGAQYSLGFAYLSGYGGVEQNLEEAIKWFRVSAEQGHARAQYKLGFIYFNGYYGVEQNAEEAYVWFLLAARSGGAEFEKAIQKIKGQAKQKLTKTEIRAAEKESKRRAKEIGGR